MSVIASVLRFSFCRPDFLGQSLGFCCLGVTLIIASWPFKDFFLLTPPQSWGGDVLSRGNALGFAKTPQSLKA